MKRILGILILLLVVYFATWLFSDLFTGRKAFLSAYNQENLLRRTALFGIISVGVAFVIITGGIDLSIGSVICLIGVGFPFALTEWEWPLPVALGVLFLVSLGIGLFHGVMVTKVGLQPFVVTLCGLLMYRGITRGFTKDQRAGFGSDFQELKFLATGKVPFEPVLIAAGVVLILWGLFRLTRGAALQGKMTMGAGGASLLVVLLFWGGNFELPVPILILAGVAFLAGILLNLTIYGRYLLALGNNVEAARFSGINTDRMIILAYVICSFLAGLAGLLMVLDVNSGQPVDFGNFYELYAIAAAVLGGCSLRGGTGTILGVIIGTALMQVLRNMIKLVDWIPQNIEFAIIGIVILAGVTADELFKKLAARRRAAKAAA